MKKLKEEIRKITGDTGSEWDLTVAGQEKLVQLFKAWALEIVGKTKICGGDLQMNDEYEQCHGYNKAKQEIRDRIERLT